MSIRYALGSSLIGTHNTLGESNQVWLPLAFSSNFSQTRGTAKKKVGLAQFKVNTKDP